MNETAVAILAFSAIIIIFMVHGFIVRKKELQQKINTLQNELRNAAQEKYNRQESDEAILGLKKLIEEQNRKFDELNQEFDKLKKENKKLKQQIRDADLTDEFKRAKDLIEKTDKPFIFISGGAGTGKSYFIENIIKKIADISIGYVAPTGLAARNIGGNTIHSFFRFAVGGITVVNSAYAGPRFDYLRKMQILVIDEISMVRADVLDAIDRALQIARGNHLPFGGVRIVAVGDLYQLAPILNIKKNLNLAYAFLRRWETPYFFDAKCMEKMPIEYVEFTKQFRQLHDPGYAAALNKIRIGDLSDLNFFNQTCSSAQQDESYVRIYDTRAPAQKYNKEQLDDLPGPAVLFKAEKTGVFEDFYDSADFPAPEKLYLKPGAAVMFIKNSLSWVNGTLGTVVSVEPDLIVKNHDDGKDYRVDRETWIEETTDATGRPESIGSYTQIPLILAWAFNVHKMQGLTFQNIVYKPSDWDLHGLGYVALSRTKSLSGLHLSQKLSEKKFKKNDAVDAFYRRMRAG